MGIAYLTVTIVVASMTAFSALGKIRRDPHIVHVIHEVVGVPFRYFPLLAACEIAGALGLVAGIRWSGLGVASGIGLVVYFAGAVVAHLRVRDFREIGPAAFMLLGAGGALVLRILAYAHGAPN